MSALHKTIASLVWLAGLLYAPVTFSQHEHPAVADTTKPKVKSPRTSAMAMIGNNHVHIDYGSPSVRGRSVWNGLVAYNQVWATGAHKATWIDFGQDVRIQGKLIAKGRYGFFTIPNEGEWVLILSKDWDMHLADDYTLAHDVVRIPVKPARNPQLVEALTYEVQQTAPEKGRVLVSWEWLNVGFDFDNR